MFRKLTDFIQEDVIIAMIIDQLRAKMVAKNVIGVTSQRALGVGSSYKIPGVGALTVSDYTGADVTPEAVSQYNEIIAIDQYKLVNFNLQNSDVFESTALNLATVWATQAGTQIAEAIDKDIFTQIFAGATADATNLGATTAAIAIDASNVLDYIEAFANDLGEANVSNDMVLVVPEFVGNALATAVGTKVLNPTIAGNIETGYVQTLFGMDIYKSNNLPKGVAGGLVAGEYAVVGGKRSLFMYVEGYTHVAEGVMQNQPASFNQYGQVYGRDFVNASGWYRGVCKK